MIGKYLAKRVGMSGGAWGRDYWTVMLAVRRDPSLTLSPRWPQNMHPAATGLTRVYPSLRAGQPCGPAVLVSDSRFLEREVRWESSVGWAVAKRWAPARLSSAAPPSMAPRARLWGWTPASGRGLCACRLRQLASSGHKGSVFTWVIRGYILNPLKKRIKGKSVKSWTVITFNIISSSCCFE